MRHRADDRLDDLSGLVAADSADELHRHLVLRPPGMRERDVFLAITALRHVHQHDSTGVGESIVLIATDPRWQAVGHPLMQAIEGADLVDDELLDVVAEAFVRSGDAVYWQCPDGWFDSDSSIEIEIQVDGVVDEEDEAGAGADTDSAGAAADGPPVAKRTVFGGTRRWAVERTLRAHPERWSAVLALTDDAPAKRAAAITMGLLDAVDVMPVPAGRLIVHRAIQCGDVVTRLAGLRKLAENDPGEARAIGQRDVNKRVRDWAELRTTGATNQISNGPRVQEPQERLF